MRLRFVLVGVGVVVVLGAWFLLVFRPGQARQAELRDEIQATQEEITSLEAQLRRLQALQAREPELRAEEARFVTALPAEPRVPDFLIQVQDAANQAQVDFLSINPSLPTAASSPGGDGPSGLQTIAVSIQTDGTFFAVQDFIFRLERLDRTVRINTFSVSGGGEAGTPSLSVSMQMQMFSLPGGQAATTEPDDEAETETEDTEDA